MSIISLQKLSLFTTENKDAAKLHKKNLNFFNEINLITRCSVQGLMALGVDYYGELTTTHVLDGIIDALKAESLCNNDIVEVVSRRDDGTDAGIHIPSNVIPILDVFQTKRIPFDDLKLFLSDEIPKNKAKIQRQSVIVCASLVGTLTHSLTYLLTHSLTHSLTHLLTHSRTRQEH